MRHTQRQLGRLVAVVAMTAGAVLLPGNPAQAQAGTNLGGGALLGNVFFAGNGVPKAGDPCVSTNFTLSGTAPGAVVNTVLTGHAGPIALTGWGGSTNCEATGLGLGNITVVAHGVGPTGSTIDCEALVGGFIRVGTEVQVSVTGDCVVNKFAAGKVTFLAVVQFVPTNPGGGVTTSVKTAAFAGNFVVIPAS